MGCLCTCRWAALRGFRAAIALVSLWMPVLWQTSTRVSAMPAGKPVVIWELACDDEACERAGTVVLSWSGLAYADCRVLDSARGRGVTRAFLNAGAAWLDLEPPLRWMSLATGIPLTSAPHDVPVLCSLGCLRQALQASITLPLPFVFGVLA